MRHGRCLHRRFEASNANYVDAAQPRNGRRALNLLCAARQRLSLCSAAHLGTASTATHRRSTFNHI